MILYIMLIYLLYHRYITLIFVENNTNFNIVISTQLQENVTSVWRKSFSVQPHISEVLAELAEITP